MLRAKTASFANDLPVSEQYPLRKVLLLAEPTRNYTLPFFLSNQYACWGAKIGKPISSTTLISGVLSVACRAVLAICHSPR